MLVLSRKMGETICIGDDIEVTVMRMNGNRVKIGIEAPHDVHIVRKELCHRDEPASRKGIGSRSNGCERDSASLDTFVVEPEMADDPYDAHQYAFTSPI